MGPPRQRHDTPPARDLEALSTRELLELLHAADRLALAAVEAALPELETAVEALVDGWKKGGRLVYVGAGTSGRLGALDAAECPPTFGVRPERVVAVVAGGPEAMLCAVEAAEDDATAGATAIDELKISAVDVVVGLSASGTTPFTCAALERAAARGATAVAVTGDADSRLAANATIPIVVAVGAEVVDGSTRLKAGTAQKLVCHGLSTAAFVRLGRVVDRYMIGVQTSSAKLRRRAEAILVALGACSTEEATACLDAADGDLPAALLIARTGIDRSTATRLLDEVGGDVRSALEVASSDISEP